MLFKRDCAGVEKYVFLMIGPRAMAAVHAL